MDFNWTDLKAHKERISTTSIKTLLSNPERAVDFSARSGDMLFDYSKTSIDEKARNALLDLAQAAQVESRRDAMFTGEPINLTEGRAVLHTALRAQSGPIFVDGQDVLPEVQATRAQMAKFAETVRNGTFQGQGGKITDVVNIGIGGSDLGPAMACIALSPYADGPRTHFVSNVDGAQIADTLKGLDPTTTLVIVASKTFTTIETMTNAETARVWMADQVETPGNQMVALSTAGDKAAAMGISADRVFGFEDWVGGRYSVWGPIGLSLMLAIGPDEFDAFLQGAAAMDDHFRTAPLGENLPVLLALVGIWNHQICGHATRAVLPYDQRLGRLPAYLQQLEMESNGKFVRVGGEAVRDTVGPIVWGEPGTNGQHAFYQLIHQGKQVVPCEFLVAAKAHEDALSHHHHLLLANCLAQSEALVLGRSFDEAMALMAAKGLTGDEQIRQARHRVFQGNRPSTTIIYPKLTPFVLGQIIALYEHRVFVEGVVMDINSFDQWGVELGKELAVALQPLVKGGDASGKDCSTQMLLNYIKENG